MANEHIDTVPAPEGPPGANLDSPSCTQNIESTLQQLNKNMGTMTELLTKVCEDLPTSDARHENRSSRRSSPGPGDKRQKRRSVSVSSDDYSENENEPRRKSRKEDDSISVHATDDDVAELLAEPLVHYPASRGPSIFLDKSYLGRSKGLCSQGTGSRKGHRQTG